MLRPAGHSALEKEPLPGFIRRRLINHTFMLFAATRLAYFLASSFLDPRSNYLIKPAEFTYVTVGGDPIAAMDLGTPEIDEMFRRVTTGGRRLEHRAPTAAAYRLTATPWRARDGAP